MRKILLMIGCVILAACETNSSNVPVYSFEDIIELRVADDETINGKEIWINSNLTSSFTLACPAVISEPCVDFPEEEDLSQYEVVNEYGHTKNEEFSCNAGNISIVADDNLAYERLIIDYNEHNEFYTITEDKLVRGEFLARVEYTQEVDYCAKKIYKGTKITLSEGQHRDMLTLFVGEDN